MDRHDRQARLADVGVAGQRAIAAATVEVHGDGLTAEVTARYLAGAGVGCLRVGDRSLGVAATSIDPAVRIEVVDPAVRIEVVDEADRSREGAQATSTDESLPGFRDPFAREVARGARAALRALRSLLEVAS